MKTFLSLLFVIIALIGIVDSSIVTYDKFAGVIPECGVGFDCGAVLNSKWSTIGPIPISLFGFFFYISVFIIGISLVLEIDLNEYLNKVFNMLNISKNSVIRNITITELLLLLTTFGFVFSLYLVFLMAFVIEAWCKYCIISAGSSTTLFIITLLYFNTVEKRSPFVLKLLNFKIINFFYTKIIKPIFFLFDAETIHDSCTKIGVLLGGYNLTRLKTKVLFSFSHPANATTLNGILFPNKVGLAAGFDYNGDLTGILPSVGMGFHTIGSVTYLPYEGNKKPRLGRFPESKSLLVNKGLKSLGAKVIAQKLSGIQFQIPTGISIASTNTLFNSDEEQILDILKTFTIFENSNVAHAYYELNISCPNTFGGEPYTTPNRLRVLLEAIEKLKITKPIFVKMPIDQSKIETLELLNVIDAHTIAGVILGNLTKDKNNPDVTKTDREKWKTANGNLSGKPTWNRSNELIQLTRRNFGKRFTIIGTGGVFNGADAVLKMKLGADMVQLITGMIFEGPQTIGEINLKLAQEHLKK